MSIPSTDCAICNMAEESCEHIFILCPWATEIWALLKNWCGIEFTDTYSVEQRIRVSLNVRQNKKKRKAANAIVLVTIWTIWKARNEKIFIGRMTPPWRIIEEIKSQSYLWVKNRGRAVISSWDEWNKFPFDIH